MLGVVECVDVEHIVSDVVADKKGVDVAHAVYEVDAVRDGEPHMLTETVGEADALVDNVAAGVVVVETERVTVAHADTDADGDVVVLVVDDTLGDAAAVEVMSTQIFESAWQ